MRIISLLLAIGLWSQVLGQQNPVVRHQYTSLPIKVVGLSGRLTASVSPESASVALLGSPQTLPSGGSAQVGTTVSAKSLKPGVHRVAVHVSAPPGTVVASLSPSQVTLTVAPLLTRRVQVDAHTVGHPALGYNVNAVTPSIENGYVQGPAGQVRQVVSLLAMLGLSGQDHEVIATVPLVPINEQGQTLTGLQVTPSSVRVQVSLALQPTKQVPVVLAFSGRLPHGVRVDSITLSPPQVTIRGPANVLAGINEVRTVLVNLAQVHGNIERTVTILAPPGALLLGGGSTRVSMVVTTPSAANGTANSSGTSKTGNGAAVNGSTSSQGGSSPSKSTTTTKTGTTTPGTSTQTPSSSIPSGTSSP